MHGFYLTISEAARRDLSWLEEAYPTAQQQHQNQITLQIVASYSHCLPCKTIVAGNSGGMWVDVTLPVPDFGPKVGFIAPVFTTQQQQRGCILPWLGVFRKGWLQLQLWISSMNCLGRGCQAALVVTTDLKLQLCSLASHAGQDTYQAANAAHQDAHTQSSPQSPLPSPFTGPSGDCLTIS